MKYSDEEYVFRKDIKDKKTIARCARHKKNGSKSKKCTMPSDYLTRKEKLKMNSEVSSWNMNTLYTYDDFKQMPNDIKIEYLQALTDKYHVGITAISSILFGRSSNALGGYLSDRGIKNKVKWKSASGTRGKMYAEQFTKAVCEASSSFGDNQLFTSKQLPSDEQKTENECFNSTLIIEQTNECKANAIDAKITLDGFDFETFNWLKYKYEGKNVQVTIQVTSRGVNDFDT